MSITEENVPDQAFSQSDAPQSRGTLASILALILTILTGCGGVAGPHDPPPTAPADTTELPERLTNSIGMAFTRIPAGSFRSGRLAGENGSPTDRPGERAVIDRPYLMGMHEVTNAQFRRFRPEHDSGYYEGRDASGTLDADGLPAVRVSWNDAKAFCEWLSDQPAERAAGRTYRLPTEDEWERAARGGRGWKYPWGDRWPADPGGVNLLEEATADGHAMVAPGGSYPPNPYGLHDLAGNVWEWVAAEYAPRPAHKIVKGASWDHHSRLRQRVAGRDHLPPASTWYDVGFRVICEIR